MTQPALPLAFEQRQPPRLPEPRDAEPYTAYLHRCIALAARYWAAWWAARKGEAC